MSPAEFRRQFAIFQDRVFVNSCSKGALAASVKDAVAEFMATWDTGGSRWDLWGARAEQARHAFARLINAADDEVAITFSASDAINSVLSSLQLEDRPRIVTSPFEFPTVRTICAAHAREGTRMTAIAPAQPTELALADYAAAVDDQTRLVTATLVCYANGYTTRWLRPLADLTHAHGATLLLDAYQGLGVEPVDVRASNVDFLVSGTHKYLLGVQGAAFLYVRRELSTRLQPRDAGWVGQQNPFAPPDLEFAPDARRFETGTHPNLGLYAALAGLELIAEVGVERIATHVCDLAGLLIEGARAQGLQVLTAADPDARGPLVAIRAARADELVHALAAEQIVASHRHGALRVSLHYYNNAEDIDRVLAALARHRDLLVAAS
jgi:selenocysteine lyase/cysteine desulfurase